MDEEYSDNQAEAEDLADAQAEYQEAMQDNMEANYPMQKEQQSLYTLFKWVIERRDSSKIGNLNKTELGDIEISVRDAQKLAHLGKIFHNPAYELYFKAHAERTLSTSLSREGFLDELFVSTKKQSTRSRKTSTPLTQQKWKLFNKTTENNP